MKKLIAVALGIALGAGGLALAQTYNVQSYLRVLNILDVRTSIQNQDSAESVVVDDNFSVTGTSNFTGAITVPSCSGCGGGSPGGSNTQVQFNDSSAFGGDAGLTYNKTTDALTVAGDVDGATFDGIASSDWARKGQANTFTNATQTISATGVAGSAWVAGADSSTAFFGISDTTSQYITGDNAGMAIVRGNSGVGFSANGGTNLHFSISSAGAVAGPGAVDMTPESGEFTATFDNACTTSPTIDFDYQRIGNLVIVKMDASTGFSCTSDATTFSTSGTPAPASIRPTNQNAVCPIMIGFTDNGASTSAYLSISTAGIVSFTRMTVSGANLQVGSWTNSGTKSAANALGGGCAYMLGNP